MAVQAWTLEQLLKLRRYQPEMVDQALEEMLEPQAGLNSHNTNLLLTYYQDR